MTHRDMGLFDFFRSRSSSLRGRNSSNAKSSTAAAAAAAAANVPPQPPASSTSAGTTSTAHTKSAAAVPAPPMTAPAVLETIANSNNNNNSFSDSDSDGHDSDDLDDRKPAAAASQSPPTSLGSIQNYEIVKELGRGATAVVQLGRHRETSELVALKVLKTSLLKKMREVKRVGRRMVVSTALDKVQVEIAIMKKLKHAHLLNLLEVFDDDAETLVLMLEYAPCGQVMHWDATTRTYRLESDDRTVMDETELRRCAQELLLGLEYLHSNNICHRDLKPENILVGAHGAYKIADFGVAQLLDEVSTDSESNQSNQAAKRGYVSTTAGTYAFMAPETLKGGAFDAFAADVWALGVTLHAFALGTIPFFDPDVVTLFEQIEHLPIQLPTTLGDNNTIDDNNTIGDNNNNVDDANTNDANHMTLSPDLAAFLYGLLEKDPEKRWTLQQAKQHAWVRTGLDDAATRAFLEPCYEAVTVSSDDVANAVTKVSSFNVLLRVKLGANRWRRKAQQSSDERKRASLSALESSSLVSSSSSSSMTLDDAKTVAAPADATSRSSIELPDNQAEI